MRSLASCSEIRSNSRPEMNSYVIKSLVRAAAFRVMFRAPVWVAILVSSARCSTWRAGEGEPVTRTTRDRIAEIERQGLVVIDIIH